MIIDPTTLEELTKPLRKFYLRLEIALQILPHLLESPGAKVDKCWAAVGYADELLNRLESTNEPNALKGTTNADV